MSEKNDDYRVGFRNPPKEHQFKKGEVHNPHGRPPKKRPNIQSALEEELASLTTIKEGNASVQVSKLCAIIKGLVKAAIDGNQRATNTVVNLCAKMPDTKDDEENSAEEMEILEAYRRSNKSDNEQER